MYLPYFWTVVAAYTVDERKNVLRHDNTTAYTARIKQEKFWNSVSLFHLHPSYPTDMAPTRLLSSLQNDLLEKTFSNKNKAQEFIENFFPIKTGGICSKVIEELTDKWQQVIASNGDYINEKKCNITFNFSWIKLTSRNGKQFLAQPIIIRRNIIMYWNLVSKKAGYANYN